jgi:hypothetical protein
MESVDILGPRSLFEPGSEYFVKCQKDGIEYPVTVEREISPDLFLVRYKPPYAKITIRVGRTKLLRNTIERHVAYQTAVQVAASKNTKKKTTNTLVNTNKRKVQSHPLPEEKTTVTKIIRTTTEQQQQEKKPRIPLTFFPTKTMPRKHHR